MALSSTEIINVSGKNIKSGGPLTPARYSFPMSQLWTNNSQHLYAFGGSGTSSVTYTDNVNRWDETEERWVLDGQIDMSGWMTAVATSDTFICPSINS